MVCIYCSKNTRVANSRIQKRQNSVWRRRVCDNCTATVTTLEKIQLNTAVVVTDKNNHQIPFIRDKLFISILNCLKHRKSSISDAAGLTDTIISNLCALVTDGAITRSDIISESLIVLGNFDNVAFVQYKAYHKL
ncbi:hypothetical protein KDA11_01885 [Candidatus Saccharibacteria bacterium]|nr:hypothetical protein [Candidatus Saccharibacteria bacterium]